MLGYWPFRELAQPIRFLLEFHNTGESLFYYTLRLLLKINAMVASRNGSEEIKCLLPLLQTHWRTFHT
jgi:hypothetical protein